MTDRPNPHLRLRGQILTRVREAGNEGVSTRFLMQVFRRAGNEWAADALEEDIRYLEDKGYVRHELIRDEASGVERWIVRLTATGLDLIQGTIPADPGVILGL